MDSISWLFHAILWVDHAAKFHEYHYFVDNSYHEKSSFPGLEGWERYHERHMDFSGLFSGNFMVVCSVVYHPPKQASTKAALIDCEQPSLW